MVGKNVLVTAALPYINNVPHMGHIAGSHLPADIYFRYRRSIGDNVILVGGSDEHGTPSALAAKQLGLRPQELVDALHDVHRQVYDKLGISYTIYSRTSSPAHHDNVREFFETVRSNGFTHNERISMYYCEQDSMFLPDRYVVGTCPKCDYTEANADQCESCTTIIRPNELIDPTCKTCGTAPSVRESEHVYIDLDRLSDQLDQWIDSNKGVWRPQVYHEAKRWIDEGLRSRSITRDMEWGIKLPRDILEDKVFYVWFDAPIGYISFTKELGEQAFETYWKDPSSEIVHFLGKDNIPFHTIFWPGMLLAHGDFNLPSNVVGYNYLNFEGKKFSKSKGVGVFCYNLLNSDVDIDVLRSYLTAVLPETRDSDFNWEQFQTITNSELIGKLGNFFNRTVSLVQRNFDGNLQRDGVSGLDENDARLMDAIRDKPGVIGNLFAGTNFRDAYRAVLQFASEGNLYFDRTAPWNAIKRGDMETARKSLYLALNLCKSLAIVASPILPSSMQRFWTDQLHLEGSPGQTGSWFRASRVDFPYNHVLGEANPLYGKIDQAELDRLRSQLSKAHSLEVIVRG
ncbi:MAG: methionine--tRNA ligase [Nanoarchaeota archaeon]